jgi:hypothetical protein
LKLTIPVARHLKVKTGISLFHLTPTLSYQGEGIRKPCGKTTGNLKLNAVSQVSKHQQEAIFA